jgi:CheY-like chemotaxis protein
VALILVVDDDPWVRKVFSEILQTVGHEVACAEDGQQGLNIYKHGDFDLVITDMIMPVKDGLKMIMELRADYPDAKIIAISGGGVIEAERYLNLADTIGAQKNLTKPVSKDDLIMAVSEVLD